jgi:hypothetical protein
MQTLSDSIFASLESHVDKDAVGPVALKVALACGEVQN